MSWPFGSSSLAVEIDSFVPFRTLKPDTLPDRVESTNVHSVALLLSASVQLIPVAASALAVLRIEQSPATPSDGTSMLGMEMLGMAMLGMATLGIEMLGIEMLGMATLGIEMLGMAMLGMAMLGIEMLGIEMLGMATLGIGGRLTSGGCVGRPGLAGALTVTHAPTTTRASTDAAIGRAPVQNFGTAVPPSMTALRAPGPGGGSYTTIPATGPTGVWVAPATMRLMESSRGASRTPSAGLASLDALVPIRSLAGGKARLGGAIDAEEREELLVGMLRHTLELLVDWPASRTVHVVSADPRALAVAAEAGAHALPQSGEGLNAGLRLGLDAARESGATAVLILPADLPLLATSSLDRLLDAADAALAAGSGAPLVVIAPSDARGGTNALLLSPPDVIAPCFGTASFEAHAREAAAADATLQLVTDPGLGFDLDTPEDLDILPTDLVEELMMLGREPARTAAE